MDTKRMSFDFDLSTCKSVSCSQDPNIQVMRILNEHPLIENLSIRDGKIENKDIIALSQVKTLTTLSLGSCNLVDEFGRNTASSSTLATQEFSERGDNHISNSLHFVEGAKILAQSKTLTKFDLSYDCIQSEGVKALAQSESLTDLNLSGNQIGIAGANELAQFKKLFVLTLNNCYMGNDEVIALAQSNSLRSLNLECNHIGKDGAIALSQIKTLTELNLYCNQIGINGSIALAKSESLMKLNLSWNQIGDEGAIALAKSKTLTELNLYYNQIGDKGANAMAKSTTLTKLNLRRNQIGDRGAIALAKSETLTELDLSYNQIGYGFGISNASSLFSCDVLNRRIAEGAIYLAMNTTLLALKLRGNKCSKNELNNVERRIEANRIIYTLKMEKIEDFIQNDNYFIKDIGNIISSYLELWKWMVIF